MEITTLMCCAHALLSVRAYLLSFFLKSFVASAGVRRAPNLAEAGCLAKCGIADSFGQEARDCLAGIGYMFGRFMSIRLNKVWLAANAKSGRRAGTSHKYKDELPEFWASKRNRGRIYLFPRYSG